MDLYRDPDTMDPEELRAYLSDIREELEAMDIIRKGLNGLKPEEAVENILNMFARTKNNAEFVQTVKKNKFI